MIGGGQKGAGMVEMGPEGSKTPFLGLIRLHGSTRTYASSDLSLVTPEWNTEAFKHFHIAFFKEGQGSPWGNLKTAVLIIGDCLPDLLQL